MSNISQKLTYLNETKSQLKDMINYGLPTENQITNETTFRNYVKGIFEAFLESLRDSTTLYTNLPKISGNGTQITLNDVTNTPMRITLKASELSQEATPTPSSPQIVHTITGDNEILISNKNLFDGQFELGSIENTTGTTVIDAQAIRSVNYISVLPSTTYTISTENNCSIFVHFYTSNKTYLSYNNVQNTPKTITTPNDCYYVKLRTRQSENITNTNLKCQLEYGSTATTYEPYVSQTSPINLDTIEYCKIGNYEDEFILTSGKNLFDGNYLDAIVGTDGKFSDNNTTKTAEIKVEPNTTYSIKKFTNTGIGTRFLVVESAIKLSNNQSGTFIYSSNSATEYSYTTGATTNYMYVYVTNDTTSIPYLMVVKGSTIPTSYEPYGTNQWYLKKNIGKVVLDGTENWSERTNVSGKHQFNAPTGVTNIVANANQLQQVSNYGVFDYSVYNYGQIGAFAILSNTKVLCINVDTNAVLNDFKTQLVSENLIVYYAYATPTYTQITGTLETQLNNIYKNMLSYKGTTNVSQINNDLPFVLEVSAIQDLE